MFFLNGNFQTAAGHWTTCYQNAKPPLPLTTEDIPILLQLVLQALPGSLTLVSAHLSTVDDTLILNRIILQLTKIL